jgi:hypothetical protein
VKGQQESDDDSEERTDLDDLEDESGALNSISTFLLKFVCHKDNSKLLKSLQSCLKRRA